jgi:NAD(P)-dependent dehydrogenase (short-subunit alcohol dehydrogenase family)
MPNSDPTPGVAIVTGASQGLGRALTAALADRGWTVVIDARRADRLERALDDFGAESVRGRVIGLAGDVADGDHRRALGAASAAVGPIKLVVNNASTLGATPLPTLGELDAATWARVFDVNVIAPFALVRELGDQLATGATVINITSDAGVEAYEGWGGYGASKAALEHASRVLAAERTDLRVLIVDPGDMRTEMHQDAFPGEDISDREPPESSVPGLLALIEGEQPSGGRYRAREIAATERSAT